jgi:hypothetical protein
MGDFRRSFLGYKPSQVKEELALRDEQLAESRRGIEKRDGWLEERDRWLAERDAAIAKQDATIARRETRVGELERVESRLTETVVERERELKDLRTELAEARERGEEGLRSFIAIGRHLDEVRAQARGQATRIRMRALRDALEVTDRFVELGRLPGEPGERILEALEGAVRRMMEAGEDPERADEEELAAAANGYQRPEPRELFEGLVQVDVGPLTDFSQLVGFEDAASSIGATQEVSIKRFSDGRATLAMKLKEPVELLRELEERWDLDFQVRDLNADRLVLDVD